MDETNTPAGPLITSGRVVTDKAGVPWVEVSRETACGGCSNNDCCSSAQEEEEPGLGVPGKMRFALDGQWSEHEGERVELACSQNGLLFAALLAYGIPTLGGVLGGVLAAGAGLGDGLQALGALGGLVLGFMLARWAVARGQLPLVTLKRN